MAVETKRSFCRFCHASCAMIVEVEDNKVKSVRGDKEDHLFHGYTCIKGRQLPDMHNLPDRMITSKIRQPDGSFKDISTAEALKLAGEQMKKMVEEHGPHSIAIYCGTNAFQNSAVLGTSYAFAQGIGSRNWYTSVTVDQPAKVFTTARYGMWMGGGNAFTESDVAMFVGNNPIVSHYSGGMPTSSPSRGLRDAKARGMKVIVADPRVSDMGKLADIYLPVKPGEDPALLAGILNVIFEEKLYDQNFVAAHVDGVEELEEAVKHMTPDIAAKRAGVEKDQLVAAARMFAGANKGRVVTGTGPEMAGNGTLTEYLVASLNILCARFNQEGERVSAPMVFNPLMGGPRKAQVAPKMPTFGEGFPKSRIRGLGHLGKEMPCNVLADEILTPGEGQVRALISIGGNPEIAFPDQQKVRRALDECELFIQIDPWMSASAKRADMILAPSMCLEREDINNVSDAFTEEAYGHYTEAMVPPPGDTMDEYEMLWWLAKHMGIEMNFPGGPVSMETCPDKATVLDLISEGSLLKPSKARADAAALERKGAAITYEDLHPVVGPADPDAQEKFDLAAGAMPSELIDYAANDPVESGFDFRLISRRSRHRYNSNGHTFPKLVEKMPTNPAFFNPADLAAAGIEDGAIIEISSPNASIFGLARADEKIRPGVISMSHAFGDSEAGKDDVMTKGGSTNRLIVDDADIDPITGQAMQSAIPVKIAAA
ncbi:molybdopterin-containing oxidoreductase family protein [Sphingorhabdus sp. 109]|uniref:molybdopterin-containing oxidoreductase family protein n=1 Tax=Sphingorhabdus sp. 109 TaxID=2653173 RepID=UPI0012F116A9|nr:molybdopterin-dependent oxidoreductase [Sphingorhabdus sp. 109]VWX61595.1 Formate dehydrogenase H [Sphingorhabdus sp. 109]